MSELAVRADGLGKVYRLSGPRERYPTLRDRIDRLASSPLRALRGRRERPALSPPFWALKDVSFEVRPGEVIGIIGRNGAGKSTLLKVLSRITEPTEGEVDINGRVGSLLEVGTGFHPELTGRENVYLNGAILGMRRAEIALKFDEIVAFAEVEKFIETPVKHYSSGMYMRLAFAVAAHLEPEILIVDEVLAVGDAEFQRRCLGKMSEVAKGGRTVLFVSHNMAAVRRLCTQAFLLRGGRVALTGKVGEVVQAYANDDARRAELVRPPHPDGLPTIVAASIVSSPIDQEVVLFELEIAAGAPRSISLDLRLADATGNPVGFGSLGALASSDRVHVPEGKKRVRIGLSVAHLATGDYVVSFDLSDPEVEFFDRLEDGLRFAVERRASAGRDRVLPQVWGYGSYEADVVRYPD